MITQKDIDACKAGQDFTCRHEADRQEFHICPFGQDVHNDATFRCTCCADCENECARNI